MGAGSRAQGEALTLGLDRTGGEGRASGPNIGRRRAPLQGHVLLGTRVHKYTFSGRGAVGYHTESGRPHNLQGGLHRLPLFPRPPQVRDAALQALGMLTIARPSIMTHSKAARAALQSGAVCPH